MSEKLLRSLSTLGSGGSQITLIEKQLVTVIQLDIRDRGMLYRYEAEVADVALDKDHCCTTMLLTDALEDMVEECKNLLETVKEVKKEPSKLSKGENIA